MRIWLILIILSILFLFRYRIECPNLGCVKQSGNSGAGDTTVLNIVRSKIRKRILKVLPSPHSELLLGMTVGLNDLDMIPRFNDILISTGTIHVVVVSGYNISLVYSLIFKILGTRYKQINVAIGVSISLIYALISGFEPPVIRAWIMGSLLVLGKLYGRQTQVVYVLVVTGLVMLIINPALIASLSFQLSFLATLGLILFYDNIYQIIPKFRYFTEDLAATLSAQLLVVPLISNAFGRISLISPLANMLVLWTVPIITIVGMVVIAIPYLAFIVFPFIDIFVRVLSWLGEISNIQLAIKMTSFQLIIYYTFLALLYVKLYKNRVVYSSI